MLRTLDINQKAVARITRCADQTVVEVERWLAQEDYETVARLCDSESIKKMISFEGLYWGLEPENLSKLDRLTGDMILRHYKKSDYLKIEKAEEELQGKALVMLCLETPSVDPYSESGQDMPYAFYATIPVVAVGGVARGGWATGKVVEKGKTFPLHWAGTPPTEEEFTAPKVDIHPDMPARLDVAFAPPSPSGQRPERTLTSGRVVHWPSTERTAAMPEKGGAWMAQPLALSLSPPDPSLDAYLQPGLWHVELRVDCDNGEGTIANLELTSPVACAELSIRVAGNR